MVIAIDFKSYYLKRLPNGMSKKLGEFFFACYYEREIYSKLFSLVKRKVSLKPPGFHILREKISSECTCFL